MKIQHYAIIFIILVLPYSIVCRARINNKIDVLNNETRINNAIDIATMDGIDTLIDLNNEYYGLYDGETIDVTPTIAKEGIKVFFQSLSVNNSLPFVTGTNFAEEYFSPYIPAIVVVAFDGFYIYSIEQTSSGTYEYVLSPKIPYAYEENGYYINFSLGNYLKLYAPNGVLYEGELKNDFINQSEDAYNKITSYITGDLFEQLPRLTDDMSLMLYALNQKYPTNPPPYFLNTKSTSGKPSMKNDYSVARTNSDDVSDFHKIRRDVIINLIIDTLNEKINAHNRYADMMGITYDFYLPTIDNAEWINAVNDVSIMAFVQGIPTSSETFYNSYALGSSRIVRTNYIYGTPDKLYHVSNCKHVAHEIDIDGYPTETSTIDNIFLTREDAALNGYYPCIGEKTNLVYNENNVDEWSGLGEYEPPPVDPGPSLPVDPGPVTPEEPEHECVVSRTEYTNLNSSHHKVTYTCNCGQVIAEFQEEHQIAFGECVCGYKTIQPHVCEYSIKKYETHNWLVHKVKNVCECGKSSGTSYEGHTFEGKKCKFCGYKKYGRETPINVELPPGF